MAKRMRDKVLPPIKVRKKVGLPEIFERFEVHGRAYDRAFLTDVYAYAEHQHSSQARRSGEPYITHPLYVAYILADLKFDPTCVAVGLLHDVLEDTGTTKEILADKFGADIAELVDGVTKIGKQSYVRRDDAQAETFRKMILASARDLRVILVKLADRLHNMMTLEHMSTEAKRRIATETLEIYAPIAHRLGMSKVQGELEDLAFCYRYPLQFAELQEKVNEKMRVDKGSVEKIRRQLAGNLEKAGITAEISYRVKRFYSIFRKLRRQEIDISQLYDYLAFRVITRDLKDTYAAFGVVHQGWRPIPGRFKDYIAMPKPNLYQSLHTTVVGKKGQPFEVQIRTQDMDLIAEEGIAAHWHYKDGKKGAEANDPNIVWLRQLLEWQKEVPDSREFLSALKIDLYPDEVYAFTPKGDVFAFPRGATPLDFAYRIHTDVGHQCSGARVNGKLVPLRTHLQNGDIVEIQSDPNRKPSRDWLSFVSTSRARSKIRQWINTQHRLESQDIGRRLLDRELKKLRLSPKKVLDGQRVQDFLKSEGLPKIEDLYLRIGYGRTPIKQAIEHLVDPEILTRNEQEPVGIMRRAVDRLLLGSGSPVTVRGEQDLLSNLAKCCNPVPGEAVVGYVTRGRGVSVHSTDCPNVTNLYFDPERLIEVEWERRTDSNFPVALTIRTEDHQGILARLTEAIAKESSNIRQCEAGTDETGRGLIEMVVEVQHLRHLDRIHRALDAVDGVLQVVRRMDGGAVAQGRRD